MLHYGLHGSMPALEFAAKFRNNRMTDDISLHDRKVIYRARRGLKELDIYFDPYVRQHYLTAPQEEKQAFAALIEQEDPDLLDWFMAVSTPPQPELADMVEKLKALIHADRS